VQAILSGPAGGVSGAAFYGQQVGLSVIGFDMGGEHGHFPDRQRHTASHHRKIEAGWKIAVPMIDMQTLGAGGGSIAQVDAGYPTWGRRGWGSSGPACYGKGGHAGDGR
jgi:N-methylhydantoinase A